LIDIRTGDLLRRHVRHGAERDVRSRHRRLAGQLGDPKIQDLDHPVLRDDKVGGLDISMNNASVVSLDKAPCDLMA